MKTKSELMQEIEGLKKQLTEVKGTTTEVYTRIVGYYRAVQNWNSGKKSEYEDRVEFDVKKEVGECEPEVSEVMVENEASEVAASGEEINIIVNDKGLIKKYKLFYSDNCPGCPPVKNYLKQVSMSGEEINAGTREGFEEAIRHNITGTPTVLFLNDAGEVVNKAHTPAQIERLIVA